MTTIRFNIRPHIRLQATEDGVARGEQGLSAYEVALKNGFEGTEVQWLASLRGEIPVTSGERSSLTDAGEFGDISLTDDFAFVCVKSGEAGSAIWKKMILFQT